MASIRKREGAPLKDSLSSAPSLLFVCENRERKSERAKKIKKTKDAKEELLCHRVFFFDRRVRAHPCRFFFLVSFLSFRSLTSTRSSSPGKRGKQQKTPEKRGRLFDEASFGQQTLHSNLPRLWFGEGAVGRARLFGEATVEREN